MHSTPTRAYIRNGAVRSLGHQEEIETMDYNRREFVTGVGAVVTLPALTAAHSTIGGAATADNVLSGAGMRERTASYVPVMVPGISTLSYEMDGGVKVFRLIAEPVTVRF